MRPQFRQLIEKVRPKFIIINGYVNLYLGIRVIRSRVRQLALLSALEL